jgi:hypothetical protein
MDDPNDLTPLRESFLSHSPHMRECGLRIRALSSAGVTIILPCREDRIGDVESGPLNPGMVPRSSK